MAEQPHLSLAAASQAQQQRHRRPAPPARTSTLFSSSVRRDTTTTYPPPLSYFFPPPKGAFLFGTPAVGHFEDDDDEDEAAVDAQAHHHLAAVSHLPHTSQHETHRDAFGMASFFPSPSPSSGWGWLVHAHTGRESDDEASDESDDDGRSSTSSGLGGGGAREECSSWASSLHKDTAIKDPHRRPSVASGLGASVAFALPSGPDGQLEVVTPGDHDDAGGVRINSTSSELDSAASALLAWWTANTRSGAPEEGAGVDGDGGAVSSPVWETSFGWMEEGEQQRSRGNEEEQMGLGVNQAMGIEEASTLFALLPSPFALLLRRTNNQSPSNGVSSECPSPALADPGVLILSSSSHSPSGGGGATTWREWIPGA